MGDHPTPSSVCLVTGAAKISGALGVVRCETKSQRRFGDRRWQIIVTEVEKLISF